MKTSSTEQKECVFKYFLKIILNLSFSFFRTLRLPSKLLKFLMQHVMYFLKKIYVGIWSIKMVLIPCIDILLIHEFVENFYDFCH